MRQRVAVVMLFLALGLALRRQEVRSQPQSDALRLGVNMHPVQDSYAPDQVLDQIALARRIGAKVVRIDIHWAWIEHIGPGAQGWNPSQIARLEAFLDGIAGSGIEILAVVTETPCWASSDPVKSCATFSYDWRYPPSDPQSFANFLTLLVTRYRTQIHYWEVWGEPNLPGYWANPDPAAYTALLKAAYPAIKAADPNAIVLGGSLGPWDGSPEYPVNALAYLEGMYAAGAKGSFDALSYHPYTDGYSPTWYDARWPMHSFNTSIPALRGCMDNHGDTSPVWITEVGWTTVPAATCVDCWTPSLPTTESNQAAYLAQAAAIVKSWDFVQALIWYELVDTVRPPDPSVVSFEHYFGLYTKDYQAKPAAAQFRDITLPWRVFIPLAVRHIP